MEYPGSLDRVPDTGQSHRPSPDTDQEQPPAAQASPASAEQERGSSITSWANTSSINSDGSGDIPGQAQSPASNTGHDLRPPNVPPTPSDQDRLSSIMSWANTSSINPNGSDNASTRAPTVTSDPFRDPTVAGSQISNGNGNTSAHAPTGASDPFRDPTVASSQISTAEADRGRAPSWDALNENVRTALVDTGDVASPPYHLPSNDGSSDDESTVVPDRPENMLGRGTERGPGSDASRETELATTASPMSSNAYGRVSTLQSGDSLFEGTPGDNPPRQGQWQQPPVHHSDAAPNSARASHATTSTTRAAPNNGGVSSDRSHNVHGRVESVNPGDSLDGAEVDASLHPNDSVYSSEMNAGTEKRAKRKKSKDIDTTKKKVKGRKHKDQPQGLLNPNEANSKRERRRQNKRQDSERAASESANSFHTCDEYPQPESESRDGFKTNGANSCSTATPRSVLGYTPDPQAEHGIPEHALVGPRKPQNWQAENPGRGRAIQRPPYGDSAMTNDRQIWAKTGVREPSQAMADGRDKRHRARSRSPGPGEDNHTRVRSPHHSYGRDEDTYRRESIRARDGRPSASGEGSTPSVAAPQSIALQRVERKFSNGDGWVLEGLQLEKMSMQDLISLLNAGAQSQARMQRASAGADNDFSGNGGPTVLSTPQQVGAGAQNGPGGNGVSTGLSIPTSNAPTKVNGSDMNGSNFASYIYWVVEAIKSSDTSLAFTQQGQGPPAESVLDLALGAVLVLAARVFTGLDDQNYPNVRLRHDVDEIQISVNEFRANSVNAQTQTVACFDTLTQLANYVPAFEAKVEHTLKGGIANSVLQMLCLFIMSIAKSTGIPLGADHDKFELALNQAVSNISQI